MTDLTQLTATLAAAQAEDRHSAPVTHWGDRIGWIVGLVLVIGLVYWLMRQGWQWRRALQGGLPALPQAPEAAGEPLLLHSEGRYHGSTTAGQWLDRIVAHGLGVRSRAALTLTAQGLDVERTGAPGFFVPAAALRGARLDKGIAGKVLTEGGLLVVTWEHGGTLIDSGFRLDTAAQHPAWAERITELSGDSAVAFTGTRPDTLHHEKEGAK
ncbi:MAG: hypothetical protein HOY69_15900 [Streptomyces sp.]|nr:hypothetical protein [Streptomyces sp.]